MSVGIAPLAKTTLATLLLAVMAVPSAEADPAACSDLSSALSGQSGLITSADWAACADPGAVGTSTLDVGLGGASALLTTGLAGHADPAVEGEPDSTVWSASAAGHGFAVDVAEYRVTVDVPAGDNCLAFDYAFASDDFDGPDPAERYRDGFVATVLDHSWTLQSGAGAYSLIAPGAFASYAVAPGAEVAATNATGYAAVTDPGSAVLGVPPGQSTIGISVYDAADALGTGFDASGDSGLFVRGLRTFADPNGCASPYNDLPVVADDGSLAEPIAALAGAATPIDVLGNDYDSNGLQFDSVPVQPSHGSATCEASPISPTGWCSYTPDQGYLGADQFTYRVTDGQGGFGTATVHLSVDTADPRTVDSLSLTPVLVAGIAKIRVSGQVSWPGGLPAEGAAVTVLAAPTGDTLSEVDQVTTDASGAFTLDHVPAHAGTWSYRAQLDSGAHADNSTSYDPDPIASVTISGPKQVQAGEPAPYVITAEKQSGATAQQWTGTCQALESDTPFAACSTSDGAAELTLTFPVEGPSMLNVEVAGASAMCQVDVVGSPVSDPARCEDVPTPPLAGLDLQTVEPGPYQADRAVHFTVQADPADAYGFICGYGQDPGPGIDPVMEDIDTLGCQAGSGTAVTSAEGTATVCFQPPAAGDWFFAVAGPTAVSDFANAPKDFVKLHVSAATDGPLSCSGGGGGPVLSTLALDGPTTGPVGTTATFTITATPAEATDTLDCDLLDNALVELESLECAPLEEGASSVAFTPAQTGSYVIRVRSGAVEDTWAFTASPSTSGLKAVTTSGPTTAYVGIPARYGLVVRKDGVADGVHPLSCGAFDQADPNTPLPAADCPANTAADGSAGFTFVPPHPGTYYVGGYVNGLTSTSQPLTVTVVQPQVSSLGAGLRRAALLWPAAPVVTGKVVTNGFDPSTQLVDLWVGPSAGTLTRVGSFRPSTSGDLTAAVARRTTGAYYQWRIPKYGKVSAAVRTTLTPAVSISVRASAGKHVVTGRVTPARRGSIVRLQRKIGSGSWRTVKTQRIRTNSTAVQVSKGAAYKFAVAKSRGARSYRVLVVADAGRTQAFSKAVRRR